MELPQIKSNLMKNPRYIYLLMIIVTAAPFLKPIGLPIPIEVQSQEFYNQIENQPPGSVILVSVDVFPHNWPEVGAGCIAIFRQLFSHSFKIIIWSIDPNGPVIANKALSYVNLSGKEYGVDYVNLGYAPGGETAVAALAKGISGVFSQDTNNTPIGSLPIMTNVANANDVDLLVILDGGVGSTNPYVNQWVAPYRTKAVSYATAITAPSFTVLKESGLLNGLMWGLRMAAEYEILIKQPGMAASTTDALSTSVLTFVILVIISNIFYFTWERKRHG